MNRLAIPISGQVLWSTGDVRLWADVRLLLKDKTGRFVPTFVRIDSGTEITTFPAYNAAKLNLPMPMSASPGVIHFPTGLEVRSGVLRFQVLGLDATEYAVSCLFLGDPAVPQVIGSGAAPRKLLQPFALLDHFRSGNASSESAPLELRLHFD